MFVSKLAVWILSAGFFFACGNGIIYNFGPGNDSPVCGNGVVETGETCDTGIAAGQSGACPTDCDDADRCTADSLQNANTCTAACGHTPVATCENDDGCCPASCSFADDSDCANPCGNGVLDAGETCDTGIAAGQAGACPTNCSDGIACTTDVLQNAGTCLVQCRHTPISGCIGNDGCCPTGCNKNTDSDCSAICGNGVVETGETCDTGITSGQGACPTTCNDGNGCTTDSLQNAGTCLAICSHTTITACISGDSCCPTSCNAGNDSDCNTVCGDGAVTGGESCDTAIAVGRTGSCPTSCNDGNSCTSDALQNPATCRALCVYTTITACANGDGCCPPGCNANNDGDCSPVCGNGVVEAGETCDTGIASGQAGACPTNCGDGNVCTTDTILNAGTCTAACSNSAITG
jgi:hypothetical protein